MGVFNKIFGGGKKGSRHKEETQSIQTPFLKLPLDERFTIRYTENGGKFIFCESFDEVLDGLRSILAENEWQNQMLYCLNPRIEERFEDLLFFTDDRNDSNVFFTTCELLIAQNGSILFCSHQIKGKRLSDLPDNFIVFATSSQLVDSLNDGLARIQQRYEKNIPDNITTVNNFQKPDEPKDNSFLTYGHRPKNVYLLLLEDQE